jgi:hypothetical protein
MLLIDGPPELNKQYLAWVSGATYILGTDYEAWRRAEGILNLERKQRRHEKICFSALGLMLLFFAHHPQFNLTQRAKIYFHGVAVLADHGRYE